MPENGNIPRFEKEASNASAGIEAGEPEEHSADVLLDAPVLKADNLELEIEDLELGGLLRIGKVRLHAENLEADLLLEVDLENLRIIVERLTNTANLGLSLFFAPAYGMVLWQIAAYKNLEIWQSALQAQATARPRTRLPAGRRSRKK